jgi:pyridoxamine 5'-phosphate oxidase
MSIEEYAKFANENPVCFLATVEGDQPRVRALAMWFADETGFYFQSQSVKALSRQLHKNSKVEASFHAPEYKKIMRVSGKIKFIDDVAMKTRCLEERTFLKDFDITDPNDPSLVVFHLYTGEAYFWTGADSMKEADIPRVTF